MYCKDEREDLSLALGRVHDINLEKIGSPVQMKTQI